MFIPKHFAIFFSYQGKNGKKKNQDLLKEKKKGGAKNAIRNLTRI